MKRKVELIVPTNLHAQLTGAMMAEIFGKGSPRVVRLTYLDQTTEDAYLTASEIAAGRESWFAMVSAVQETRRNV